MKASCSTVKAKMWMWTMLNYATGGTYALTDLHTFSFLNMYYISNTTGLQKKLHDLQNVAIQNHCEDIDYF